MIRIFCVVLILLLAGCANLDKSGSPEEIKPDKALTVAMRQMMLGEWCGEKNLEDGSYQKWLVTRFADGTYKIEFTKVSPVGLERKWGEYGVWGIRHPIYFTAMRGFIKGGQASPADTTAAAFYDAYKVVSLTENEFTYKSYTSGNTFTIKRRCSTANS